MDHEYNCKNENTEAERKAGEARVAAAIESERIAEAKRAADIAEFNDNQIAAHQEAEAKRVAEQVQQSDMGQSLDGLAGKSVRAKSDMVTEFLALQSCSPADKKIMRAAIEKWEAHRKKMEKCDEGGSMSHTSEPWRFEPAELEEDGGNTYPVMGAGIYGPDRESIYTLDLGDYFGMDTVNARRIVACVNACAGISTEGLERGTPIIAANQLLAAIGDEYKQQRDELLTAASKHIKEPE